MWLAIIALRQHKWSNDVRRGLTSSTLNNTRGRTTLGVTCHHRIWTAHMVERRWAWHAIITFGQHTRLSDVRLCMPSSPLGTTPGRTTSGVACHHCLWKAHTIKRRRAWHAIITFGKHTRSIEVGRVMTSPPLEYAHDRTTSSVACHHRLQAEQTVK